MRSMFDKNEKKIKGTLNAQFEVPDKVKTAQREAFEKIRAKADAEKENTALVTIKAAPKKKFKIMYRAAFGMAATAAVFSVVCITNPAMADNIPVIGSVFREIGSSLGFAGDYEEYARPLEEGVNTETATEQTFDGTTITLSEVYCNDTAMYISMLIKTEDVFPETFMMQNSDMPIMCLWESSWTASYNPDYEYPLLNANLDGKMLDEHTYAGMLRMELPDISYSEKEGETVTVPDAFTADLNISAIMGNLPEEQVTKPEMPQEFKDEYTAAMAEYGLDESDYENFTEEEKDIELRMYNEMWEKYAKRYPDAVIYPNKYENWEMKGDWKFTLDVEKDHTKTIQKELNLLDKEGNGIVSITKTPFELTMEVTDPDAKYFAVPLDAQGNLFDYGRTGSSAYTWAVNDSDTSKIYVYLCDYMEYMDELKGYYWSDDYEEKAKTKTFKQLLDERAIMHTEVTFDE